MTAADRDAGAAGAARFGQQATPRPCAACGRPKRLHSDKPVSPMHDWHAFKERKP